MTNLPLTPEDFREVLSSLLLAELPYNVRLQLTSGASLTPEFEPTPELFPTFDKLTDKIRAVFGVPLTHIRQATTLNEWAEILHEEWKQSEQKITFFTSGSTGDPKPTTHDFALHVQEVHALAKIFENRTRIVSFVPRHHIYGFLFSVMLPKAMQVEVHWEAPLPAPGAVRTLQPGDLMIAFPLLWGKLEEMNLRFGIGIHGVTSTGPCPATTIESLCINGLERMYEIYGSSETGGVGFRHSPQNRYALLDHWAKTDAPAVLHREHPGQGQREYELQDVLDWRDDTFLPMRRTDNAVQVAGVNVYPAQVRTVLRKHPNVKECAVRLMRPEEGTRLKALIVPQNVNDLKTFESSLSEWAKQRLSPYEQPKTWTFAKRLPTNEIGKLKDW